MLPESHDSVVEGLQVVGNVHVTVNVDPVVGDLAAYDFVPDDLLLRQALFLSGLKLRDIAEVV